MGATNFGTTKVAKNPKEAYKEAVEGALYEHGNDGYNGTISTTEGYFILMNTQDGELRSLMTGRTRFYQEIMDLYRNGEHVDV